MAMKKIFMSIFLLFISTSNSIVITCNFSSDSNWWVIEGFYFCSVANNLDIESSDNVTITSVMGVHQGQFLLDNVQGFEAEDKNIFYFPKNLEKFFKNLEMIDINYGPLKEIHQSDLKPFSKLKCLELYHNEIEVLESGLFDFNLDLEMIWLSSNKIFHIEPEIFNHLIGKLRYFSLDQNECTSGYVENSTNQVIELIKNATKNCVDTKIYVDKILTKIERLEVKFENFEKNFEIEKENLVKNEVDMTLVGSLMTFGCVGIILGIILWKIYVKKSKVKSLAFENFKFEHEI